MHRPLTVLIIDEEIPLPANAGKRIRTWNLLRRVAQVHQVHFLCYGEESVEAEQVREAGVHLHLVRPLETPGGLQLGLRLLANLASPWPYSVQKHHTRRFREAVAALCRHISFDLIQCEWTPYASFRGEFGQTPWMIATHNIETDIWERRAEHAGHLPGRIFFGLQAAKMKRFEARAFAEASGLGAVSEHDAVRMRRQTTAPVHVVDNGVDLDSFSPAGSYEQLRLLYLGSLDWRPNVDAIEHLVQDIWPLIRRACPAARLEVVGRRASAGLRALLAGADGVTLHSDVADVRPMLAQSILVVPLRIGGGTRIKILEAMGMARPVVSSRIGAEGLELQDGRHLLLADDTAAFADRTVQLLNDAATAQRIGRAARERVEQRYGWDRSAARLMDLWVKAVEAPTDPSAAHALQEKAI